MDWFMGLEFFEQAFIVLGAFDIILGALPDKYSKGYPGMVLAVADKLFQFGKESKEKHGG